MKLWHGVMIMNIHDLNMHESIIFWYYTPSEGKEQLTYLVIPHIVNEIDSSIVSRKEMLIYEEYHDALLMLSHAIDLENQANKWDYIDRGN
jgi:hypothetical protein